MKKIDKKTRKPKLLKTSPKRILVPMELQDMLDFLFSMGYSCKELKELSCLEVDFIKQRCKEERIYGDFNDLIKYLDIGVYYDEKGNRHWC